MRTLKSLAFIALCVRYDALAGVRLKKKYSNNADYLLTSSLKGTVNTFMQISRNYSPEEKSSYGPIKNHTKETQSYYESITNLAKSIFVFLSDKICIRRSLGLPLRKIPLHFDHEPAIVISHRKLI